MIVRISRAKVGHCQAPMKHKGPAHAGPFCLRHPKIPAFGTTSVALHHDAMVSPAALQHRAGVAPDSAQRALANVASDGSALKDQRDASEALGVAPLEQDDVTRFEQRGELG